MHPVTLLSVTLLLFTANLTLASPTLTPGNALGKRQCEEDCRCAQGTNPGRYCWGCGVVIYPGDQSGGADYKNRVFECGPTLEDCCMQEARSECAGGQAGLCPW
ncbi:hypothetical protein DFP73DRAFT_632914 [Morchella snyderi]|nr:hypothetical protein DFP73DRAFT_632914 [Morchella snyderi]